MISDPNTSEQSLPDKTICGILSDSENLLDFIHVVNSFFFHILPPCNSWYDQVPGGILQGQQISVYFVADRIDILDNYA